MTPLFSAPTTDLPTNAYCVLGVATCFVKDDGQVLERQIIEPIPSAALETLLTGIPTSYSMAIGTTLDAVVVGDSLQRPAEFPAEAQFCDEFVYRSHAAARTYCTHPEAQQHIPSGTMYQAFNYSTERKRILNARRAVKTEDNVKQHAHTHKVL
jgi:hypothetical protein